MRSDPNNANFDDGDRNTIGNKSSVNSTGDASTATATQSDAVNQNILI